MNLLTNIKNVLVVGAHPDDLEWMAGGTISRIIQNGGKVHLITLSDGSWQNSSGVSYRQNNISIEESKNASKILGYSFEYLDESTLHINYSDTIVTKVLFTIEQFEVDTIICPWFDDLHRDHEMTSRIAIGASRKIPRVLLGQCNWYIYKNLFTPNIFIDISETYKYKIQALKCYKSEMNRVGTKWLDYIDSITKTYGYIASAKRAEGFISSKFCF